jgi:ribosomal protein S18 acetylase RimI-like enzyme
MPEKMTMAADVPPIERNKPVSAEEIENLRAAVGWDRAEGTFDRVLRGSYAYYTVHDHQRLIGFLNVVSDGVGDAFLLNLTVHPSFQNQGIGRAMVMRAVKNLTAEGIQCIQVTFASELESFYRKCGFDRFAAGIIDNAAPTRRIRRNQRAKKSPASARHDQELPL